jgi:ABC-type nitrate/sulfonate/bicarbonate transport system substrate-binding protein
MAEAQTQKVRISISSRSNTSVSYYVAAGKGFFREEGMDVEIIQANPRLGVMALMNGDMSFTGTFVSTVRGILSGFPLKIVVVAFKKGVYYLMAHPSIKDIKNKKTKRVEHTRLRSSGCGRITEIEGLQSRAAPTRRAGRYGAAPAIGAHRSSGSDRAFAAA